MANNRMFLLHVPTKTAVYLGKRLGQGWYDVPGNVRDKMRTLFETVDGDDFAVALEDTQGTTKAIEISVTELKII